MSWIQTELLPKTEIDLLREEITELRKALSAVRKGIFARHEDLADEMKKSRERDEQMNDSLNQLRERLNHYEEALFPELGVMAGGEPGLRFMSMPVSDLMICSQSSSTGLLLPHK